MKLTDDMVRSVLRQTTGAAPLTFRELQGRLRQSYGCVGRRERVLMLLRQHLHQTTAEVVGPLRREDDERVVLAEERAARAEEREEAHMRRWVQEVDALRLRLRERAGATSGPTHDQYHAVFRELRRCQEDRAILAARLRALGVDPEALLRRE